MDFVLKRRKPNTREGKKTSALLRSWDIITCEIAKNSDVTPIETAILFL
jgi:hypothetical protein